jgi:16S rRNA (uracil1498-N3)-methyltransferase
VSRPVFFLADAADATVGDSSTLVGPEGHHASVVRRVRPGERVVLTDGRGTALEAAVTTVGRGEVTCLVEAVRRDPEPAPRLTVVQALPKGDRGELAVDLLTEVGVDRVVPWQAERCVTRWKGDKVERGRAKWASASREAAKQSRRTWWPEVGEVEDTDAVVALLHDADRAWALHEGASASLAALLQQEALHDTGSVVLVVGPEGGLTDDELATFADAGAVGARLGPTVLRTSTAGVVGAALVLGHTTSWRA